MSRQIKFRLRNEVNVIVGYEKWYPGTLRKDGTYEAHPCWLYSKDGERWNPNPFPHRYKDESTGLHDKNGKEIWEWDVVRCRHIHDLQRDRLGEIDYIADPFASFVVRFDTGVPFTFKEVDSIEVIGNRFENPELLK